MYKIYPKLISSFYEIVHQRKNKSDKEKGLLSIQLIVEADRKTWQLLKRLFEYTDYLSIDIQKVYLPNEIILVNKTIIEKKEWKEFYRPDPEIFETISFLEIAENLICNLSEYQKDTITDYLAELIYFDEINCLYFELQKGVRISKDATPKLQLQTNLTDTQRGKLFDLLVSNGFIPETEKEGFIWAFGGEQDQPNDWQPIEWIDKSITRKEPNIQTLYELLYLLGVDKDTSANNPNNLYRKMQFCFSGLKNIAAKNPCSIQQNTDRQKLLKTIIEEVEKVGAQK